jgi:hypothetical protein
LSAATPLFEPLAGATCSAVEYALILAVTEILLGLQGPLPRVIVRVWTNFSDRCQIASLELLSTVTRLTEGLLKNNLNDLFRARDTLDDFTGRQILHPNSLIHQAITQCFAGGAHAHAAQVRNQCH